MAPTAIGGNPGSVVAMALLHRAQLTPSKLELLQAWLPTQPWAGGFDPAGFSVIGAYRFDDPAGQVGIETHLIGTAEGAVLQVPTTYRAEPLAGVVAAGTTQHSVLGPRWVYDGCLDPAYQQALLTTIVTGGQQAELFVATDDGLQRREPTTFAQGSGQPGAEVPAMVFGAPTVHGSTTVLLAGPIELTVLHVLDASPVSGAVPGLTGRWPGQEAPALLALIRGLA